MYAPFISSQKDIIVILQRKRITKCDRGEFFGKTSIAIPQRFLALGMAISQIYHLNHLITARITTNKLGKHNKGGGKKTSIILNLLYKPIIKPPFLSAIVAHHFHTLKLQATPP